MFVVDVVVVVVFIVVVVAVGGDVSRVSVVRWRVFFLCFMPASTLHVLGWHVKQMFETRSGADS